MPGNYLESHYSVTSPYKTPRTQIAKIQIPTMGAQIKNQYDSYYASKEVVFGEGKPIDAVTKLTNYINNGTVLDIGGGEGRNALYLSKLGFKVSVFDISEVGIYKLKKVAQERGLKINTHVGDIVSEKIIGMYDSVINSFVLHHMTDKEAREIIIKSQNCTNDDGVYVLSTFMNKGDLYERNRESSRFYPSEETLENLYSTWYIRDLSTEEILTHAKNKKGERMKNYAVTLIASKKK